MRCSRLGGGDWGVAYLDNTGAFVTQDHISLLVVQVGPADRGVGDFDKDLIVAKFLLRLGLDVLASLRPLENREVNHTCVYVMLGWCEK